MHAVPVHVEHDDAPAPCFRERRPGDPLRELHLARELGVSQATVREGLVQLERLGLVVRTPNIGTHVTKLSRQEIEERVELRKLLAHRGLAREYWE